MPRLRYVGLVNRHWRPVGQSPTLNVASRPRLRKCLTASKSCYARVGVSYGWLREAQRSCRMRLGAGVWGVPLTFWVLVGCRTCGVEPASGSDRGAECRG